MKVHHITAAEREFIVRSLRVVAAWDQNIVKRLTAKEQRCTREQRQADEIIVEQACERIADALRLAGLLEAADIDIWH